MQIIKATYGTWDDVEASLDWNADAAGPITGLHAYPGSAGPTDTLRLSHFGFAIGAADVILGIEAHIHVRASNQNLIGPWGGTVSDALAAFQKSGAEQADLSAGNLVTSGSAQYDTADAEWIYGGPTYLPGGYVYTDLNSSGFGFDFQGIITAGGTCIQVLATSEIWVYLAGGDDAVRYVPPYSFGFGRN